MPLADARSTLALAKILAPRVAPWLLAALSMGCAPQIGDKCAISTDCSVNGDRLCDTTQPDGYCTVFNCQPDSCPGDSVCVAFRDSSCGDIAGRAVRFQRTFCMKSCQGDNDCRSGYTCQDVLSQIVDTNPSNGNVCEVAATTVPPAQDAGTNGQLAPICLPFDGSFSSMPDATGADAPEAAESVPDATEAGGEAADTGEEAADTGEEAADAGEEAADAGEEAADAGPDASE